MGGALEAIARALATLDAMSVSPSTPAPGSVELGCPDGLEVLPGARARAARSSARGRDDARPGAGAGTPRERALAGFGTGGAGTALDPMRADQRQTPSLAGPGAGAGGLQPGRQPLAAWASTVDARRRGSPAAPGARMASSRSWLTLGPGLEENISAAGPGR
ncbi:hypothetical protein H696_04225 [Fonticula alba]|uniref:Uncharacterized protein n=1 Tax=Fonticula alba TaxID=691883 RepID=A0A058Z4F4_FONAL|nr:hypothetical protein H696_04225 [Fonticula alba]KCV68808.1 hypothetical protein H696_04225 [Fonticula alba]|eukprot:XP_009496379.1 hypothetical protein H696_04225 [Fonticula alba]